MNINKLWRIFVMRHNFGPLALRLLQGLFILVLVVGGDESFAARARKGMSKNYGRSIVATQSSSRPIGSRSASTGQLKRVALVIGNARYINVNPLRNSVKDANDIAVALRGLGFEVDLKTDVSDQRAMRDLVANFGAKLQGGGVGLFFYAGHGLQINGENYLVPVEAKNVDTAADIPYEMLSIKYVQDQMKSAENELNIIILDACRNNPLTRSMRGVKLKRGESAAPSGLATMKSPPGTLIAFATSPDETAEDGDGENGTYTKNLLANIATKGISVADMFMNVRKGVLADTRGGQLPWESTSVTTGFCFAGCADDLAKRENAELKARLAAMDRENRARITAEQALNDARERANRSNDESSRYNDGIAEENARLRREAEKARIARAESEANARAALEEAERVRQQYLSEPRGLERVEDEQPQPQYAPQYTEVPVPFGG